MKKLTLITAIALIVTMGCSKEELKGDIPSPAVTQNVDYMPLAIGNYWVYDTYIIDTLGNETLSNSSDSAYIDRDTIVNGETYYILNGDFNAKIAVGSNLRNNNNSILGIDGSIFFTTNNLGSVFSQDTISLGPGGDFIYLATWVNTQTSVVTVPAGSFSCFDKETELISTQIGYPFSPRSRHSYYNKDVGVVINQYYFYSSPNVNESRLVRFNIN